MGINTATVEYTPNADSCALIGADSLFTLEAGANYQYRYYFEISDQRDGTTYFTRTVHFGNPTDLEKEIYTRILKGILSVESTPFPEGTTGVTRVENIV